MTFEFTDKNLLFALVTLKNGFVSQEEFVEVLNQWSADKNQPVEENFLESNLLEQADVDVIKALVKRQVELNASQSLVENSGELLEVPFGSIADSQVRADLKDLSLSQKMRSTRALNPSDRSRLTDQEIIEKINEGDNQYPSDASSDFFEGVLSMVGAPDRSRYKNLRPYAKGGLGTVSLAEDTELGRDVAVKEIRPSLVDDANARNRFEMEAFITGGLEHPGVVPVYGFGRKTSGSPFLAMKFVKGKTLKKAVLDFHENGSLLAPEQKIEFRDLLSRLIDCCNTIAYAHNRGVIHRDVKPSNIMLGKFGETLVVDWGLAKPIGREMHHKTPDEATLVIQGSPESTMDGSTVGTPAFMSPEQAQGRIDDLKPTSDIYSLGATLYYILTGQAPFKGQSAKEVIKKVCVNEFPEPRLVNPAVPPQLNSICCKAMSLAPQDRYLTGQQLATDIQNWLADEDVAAHNETVPERVHRWLRNNQILTVSMLAVLGTLLLAALGSIYLVDQARQKTEVVNQQLEREKKKVTTSLELSIAARQGASAALEKISNAAIDNFMARGIDTNEGEKQFLDLIDQQFEDLATSFGDDDYSKFLQAKTILEIGNQQRKLEHFDNAKSYLEKAEGILRSLVKTNGDSTHSQCLAKALSDFAILLKVASDFEEAQNKEREAIQILVASQGDDENISHEDAVLLASLYSNYGNTQLKLKNYKEAKRQYLKANEIFEKAGLDNDGNASYVYAANSGNLGSAFQRERDYPKAVEFFEYSINEFYDLLESEPANTSFISGLSSNHRNLGVVLKRQCRDFEKKGQKEQARQKLQQAIDECKLSAALASDLNERYPNNSKFKRELGMSFFELGDAHGLHLGVDLALEQFEAAENIFTNLIEKSPTSENQFFLARSQRQQGDLYLKNKDKENAIVKFRLAADRIEQTCLSDPRNFLIKATILCCKISKQFVICDRNVEAIERLEKLVVFFEAYESLPQFAVTPYFQLAELLQKEDRYEDAMPLWDSIARFKDHANWSLIQAKRAICKVRVGEIPTGVRMVGEIYGKSDQDVSPLECYNAAACFAVAAQLDEQGEERDRYAVRAIEALQRAGRLEPEYFARLGVTQVAQDPDLVSLHGRKDFILFREQFGIPDPKDSKINDQ